MVQFLLLHRKQEAQGGGGESDGVVQQSGHKGCRDGGALQARGAEWGDHFCLVLAETHHGFTPVTHLGDGAKVHCQKDF